MYTIDIKSLIFCIGAITLPDNRFLMFDYWLIIQLYPYFGYKYYCVRVCTNVWFWLRFMLPLEIFTTSVSISHIDLVLTTHICNTLLSITSVNNPRHLESGTTTSRHPFDRSTIQPVNKKKIKYWIVNEIKNYFCRRFWVRVFPTLLIDKFLYDERNLYHIIAALLKRIHDVCLVRKFEVAKLPLVQ